MHVYQSKTVNYSCLAKLRCVKFSIILIGYQKKEMAILYWRKSISVLQGPILKNSPSTQTAKWRELETPAIKLHQKEKAGLG